MRNMRVVQGVGRVILAALCVALPAEAARGAGAAPAPVAEAPAIPFSLRRFTPERRPAELAFEEAIKGVISADSLREFHSTLASAPHPSGSEGDLRVIDFIARRFAAFGLETETQWIWPYLSKPLEAELEIIAPEREALTVAEPPVEGDSYSADPRLTFGFNAYSGSGEVTAEVVYANYGTKEDFERLAELGVTVKGRIVLARYGGNFRGYKAKYAQQSGAAGLIIYTDPAESGYMRGLMYPEGGWSSDQQIQRGSLATLDWPGDPLTPAREATRGAKRLDPDATALPRIPVQPVGWAAAQRIMSRMAGEGVPEGWQGAMPFPYRLTGGEGLKVRMKVRQARELVKTANVVATLRGARFPDEWIIVGCHHDAWGFGAADPLAGMMLVMEAARRFAGEARAGRPPDRSILFAAWAAEEHGIVGSVEWVEAHERALRAGAVAYINLDMAAMGPLLGASGTPSLRALILDAARATPQARDPGVTAYDQWLARTPPDAAVTGPIVGSMGGGSDHIGFYFRIGAPTMSFGASGGRGTSYHSNYDNLHWYRKVVGEDYEPAVMLTRAVAVTLARLANADALPLDPAGYAPDLRRHLAAIENLAHKRAVSLDLAPLRAAIDAFEESARSFNEGVERSLEHADSLSPQRRAAIAAALRGLESAWLDEQGLPGRPWYRSLYMAPDETSGYAAWPLPALRGAVEKGDAEAATGAVRELFARVEALREKLSGVLPATP